MSRQNVRTPSPPSLDPYDPKARAVGSVVLFLLMMLLYAILKALLGISSTGAEYALRAPLPDEVKLAQSLDLAPQTPDNNSNTSNSTNNSAAKSKYPVINKFVFLDLAGKPMEGGAGNIELPGMTDNSNHGNDAVAATPEVAFDGADGKEWFVQAASFKEQERAQEMLKRLKDNNFEATIVKVGDWYAVRLMPQANKSQATQQLRALSRVGIRGQVRRVK